MIQQLREAFPHDTAPRHLIFDRDKIFSPAVVRFVKAIGTKPTRTAYRCPWQNPVAERWVGDDRALQVLTRARRDVDLARVRTIHSFCMRLVSSLGSSLSSSNSALTIARVSR